MCICKKKHKEQRRYSGIPYYLHVFEVGKLLAEIGMSVEVVAAGILHDTLEDTDTTMRELEKEFNPTIAFFVDSITHLGEIRYQGLDMRVKSLQNGDMVEIETGKKVVVNKKWLDWVKTSEARSRIRSFIKKNS